MTHLFLFFFFFNDTATTEIYTLSLHDALPIWPAVARASRCRRGPPRPRLPCTTRKRCMRSSVRPATASGDAATATMRSEEHTSELQSQSNLVCRLLLEKKKKKN